jgi:hypothetical protein
MGQLFDNTRDHLKQWRKKSPRVFGEHIDRSNPETISLGMVKRTGKWVSRYVSDHLWTKIELHAVAGSNQENSWPLYH